jgi:hypothetical protein
MDNLTSALSSLWTNSNTVYNTKQTHLSDPNILKLGNMLQTMLKHVDNHDIDIPTIISFGSQSSGKSSVINGILAMDILPTGSAITTRTPLRLELTQILEEDVLEQPRMEFGSYSGSKMAWRTNKVVEISLPIPTKRQLEDVSAQIELLTKQLAGDSQNVSSQEINIKLFSPLVPNLTIIDLPGVVQVACRDRGQPENIKEQILNMAEKYAMKKNTVIMAVMQARPDLEADNCFEHLKKWDPEGKRTLGVLTKTDLLIDGDVSDYLTGNCSDDLKLGLGYFAVRNRSFEEMKTYTAEEGCQLEMKYFKDHPIYAKGLDKVYRNRFGVKNLSSSLSGILVGLLKSVLPSVVHDLKCLRDKTGRSLDIMGTAVPKEVENTTPMIHNLITYFTTSFVSGVSNTRGTSKDTNTGRSIKGNFENFRKEVTSIKPFSLGNQEGFTDQFIRQVIQNFEGNSMAISVPPIEILEHCVRETSKDPFKTLITCSHTALSRIKNDLNILSDNILTLPRFKRFPKIVEFVSKTLNKLVEEEEISTRQAIRNLIRMEECYVWTEDTAFRNRLGSMSYSYDNDEKHIQDIRCLLQEYFACCSEVIAHTVPKAIMFHFVKNVQEHLSDILFRHLSRSQEENNVLLSEGVEELNRRQSLEKNFKRLNALLVSDLMQL